MSKRSVVWTAVIIGISFFSIPIILALYMSVQKGQADASDYLDDLAVDILRRSAGTRSQVDLAIKGLKADGAQAPCSASQMENMTVLAAKAGYLQGLGYIKDNILLCSTLSQRGKPVALGKESRRTPDGMKYWHAAVLPNIPGVAFNITESEGYAAIIYPDLVVDILPRSSPITVAQVSTSGNEILRLRGVFRDEWLQSYRANPSPSFTEGGYLVVFRQSGHGDTVAVAAMPEGDVEARITEQAWRLVPIGIFAGMLLAFGVYALAKHRMSFKSRLLTALKNHEFFLLYQPVMDLQTGRCTGAEALIRWRAPDGKIINPVDFIPAAEANGLIQQVTAQVMDMVAEDAVDLIKNYPDVQIAINLSAEDLHSPDTEPRLRAMLKKAGAHSRNIVIEATERGLMSPEKARGILKSVRSQGFRVAIDNFGTGNSGLSYLATYDLDFLKIAKIFVDALESGNEGTLAFHIVGIARSQGLQMIAEGVETESQRDILRNAGVQYAQGWLFGRPMPMKDLASFMQSHNLPAPA